VTIQVPLVEGGQGKHDLTTERTKQNESGERSKESILRIQA
jgi:hypothetical protein